MASNKLTQQELQQRLDYDANTGVFTWLTGALKGRRAGGVLWVHGIPHWRIKIDGRNYYAVVLAWLYMTGEYPPGHTQHLNGNTLDNRWRNLKPGRRPARRRRDSTTGHPGVSFHKKSGLWRARIRVHGRDIELGSSRDKRAVIALREAAERGEHPKVKALGAPT